MDRKSIKGTNYFEGILQLRDCTKEAVRFARDDIEKQPEEKRAFINKEVKLKNGYDLYLTSNRYLRSLGKKLVNKFGGQLKESAKLFSRHHQTSKELYRVSVLFRMPNFQKGDIIKYKGEELKVKAMGKKVFAVNVKSGKKYNINFKELL
ncbi:NMD3-related protein [Nanoarchaeota archaeon]